MKELIIYYSNTWLISQFNPITASDTWTRIYKRRIQKSSQVLRILAPPGFTKNQMSISHQKQTRKQPSTAADTKIYIYWRLVALQQSMILREKSLNWPKVNNNPVAEVVFKYRISVISILICFLKKNVNWRDQEQFAGGWVRPTWNLIIGRSECRENSIVNPSEIGRVGLPMCFFPIHIKRSFFYKYILYRLTWDKFII